MSLLYFLKLLLKNWKWLLIIPVSLAASIFYFTRKEPKVYGSEAVIYTGIASGYSLSGNNKVDYVTVNNAFDNLISLINSKETKREVALTLLAEHLCMPKHDNSRLSWDAWQSVKEILPEPVKRQLTKPTVSETFQALNAYMHQNDTNVVYRIVHSAHPYYSVLLLDNIKPMRINNSDLIKVSYETNDAAICKHTLELILQVFMRKFRLIKEDQSESVVAYFEEQTHRAFARLDSAEQEFLNFNRNNNIINYYEQTKAVADQKERLYTQDHNIEMDETAAGESLNKVNENIEGRRFQTMYGGEVMQQREELSDIYNRIAVTEALSRSKGNDGLPHHLDSLRTAAGKVEQRLQGSLAKLYEKSNTPNGIPTREVLNEWLQNMLAFEQNKARLTVMEKRKKVFESEYKKYAPLGAMLKKIERKINVSEREYLELLHDLSVARLAQQNNELTTKLNVVDPPFLPLTPNASKRLVLVVVGFVVGLILVIAVIVARALADKTLQHPYRAAKAIGQPLLGLFPLQSENREFVAKASLRLMQHLLPCVDTTAGPAYIGLLSVQEGEGKSMLMALFREKMAALGFHASAHPWNAALPAAGPGEIVLLELPALESTVLKPGGIPKLQYTVLVCRANRIWSKIDKEMLRMFIKTTGNSPAFVLNGVKASFAEEFIGEVPKNRFLLRTRLKRIVKFEFGNRRTLRS